MTQNLWLPFRLPSLNEYIGAERSPKRWIGSSMKKTWTNKVQAEAEKQLQPHEGSVSISLYFYEPNSRRDPDGISGFARKAILDGLVQGKILLDDSQKYIVALQDTWKVVEKSKVGVLVTLMDSEAR